jgi:hypothetical protein
VTSPQRDQVIVWNGRIEERPTLRRASPGAAYAGAMFWLTWKRLSGSYFRLTAAKRS